MSLVARYGRAVPQAGALLAAAPMLAVGFGLGMIGAPLADLTLGKVAHHHAGSASGLFNERRLRRQPLVRGKGPLRPAGHALSRTARTALEATAPPRATDRTAA
ncbi:hypothetical protein [Streptomyces sp. NPDC015345]|uniref:hypothetical protein n=1 Tax=Streptomyces sp. NPDC015345 TaxID=3364953 RepID=UPI0036FF7BB0